MTTTNVITIRRIRTSPDAYVFEIDGRRTGTRVFDTDERASRAAREVVANSTASTTAMKTLERNPPMTHPIRSLVLAEELKLLHIPPGKRFPVFCGCHGHCGECKEPVTMNRVGKFVHVKEHR
jgi:hypothetical protein